MHILPFTLSVSFLIANFARIFDVCQTVMKHFM